jgi:integrase
MSVRKRKWTTRGKLNRNTGEREEPKEQEAWIVDYTDQSGKRHAKHFERKKDADAYHAEVRVDVKAGVHLAPSKSPTLKEAGDGWLRASEANGLERTTLEQYGQHLKYHLVPFIGAMKLADITPPVVRKLEGDLLKEGRSKAMVRKVLVSLGSILADAQEQGLAVRNAVRELRRNRRKGKDRHAEKREKGKLKVGVDIPTVDEVRAILGAAKGRWRPFLVVAAFTGLRASELRGLRWADVDLRRNELHVRQRADRFRQIGKPKSHAGERTVPLPPSVTSILREWKLACPPGELVFPNGKGGVEFHQHIIRRGLIPTMVAASITTKDGAAKYTGLHSLRHFYASWCINRTKDGGLGLPPKNVQERLGHATIAMTLDRYGHLFRGDDADELDKAAQALLAW